MAVTDIKMHIAPLLLAHLPETMWCASRKLRLKEGATKLEADSEHECYSKEHASAFFDQQSLPMTSGETRQ